MSEKCTLDRLAARSLLRRNDRHVRRRRRTTGSPTWNAAWGYLWFSELGLYYVHGRWYSPELGRFLSPNEKGDYMYGGDGPCVEDAVNCAWDYRDPCDWSSLEYNYVNALGDSASSAFGIQDQTYNFGCRGISVAGDALIGLRGGSWLQYGVFARRDARYPETRATVLNDAGFRLVASR